MSEQQQPFMKNKAELLFNYKSAIALNNMGVTLLHRGCCNDALMVLQNAFSLLCVSWRESLEHLFTCFQLVNSDTSHLLTSPQDMLFVAGKKLAKSTIVGKKGVLKQIHPIVTLTADMTSHLLLDTFNFSPASDDVYLVRIEERDEEDVFSDDDNFISEIVTVLSNIGTMHRLHAAHIESSSFSSQESPKKSVEFEQAIQRGLSFCQAARSMLSLLESTGDENNIQDCVHLLILDNLMNLSSYHNDRASARKFYIELGDLYSDLQQQEQLGEVYYRYYIQDSQCYYDVPINESFQITAAKAA
jgi:hypothetical protein